MWTSQSYSSEIRYNMIKMIFCHTLFYIILKLIARIVCKCITLSILVQDNDFNKSIEIFPGMWIRVYSMDYVYDDASQDYC